MPNVIKQHRPNTPRLKAEKKKALTPNRTLALNGAAWARLRRYVLSQQPLCAECERQGRIRASLDVDHVDNDASNNDLSNLEALCHSCHSRKTRRDYSRIS